jgi:hypothetical protein
MNLLAKLKQVPTFLKALSVRRRLALLGVLLFAGLLLTGLGGGPASTADTTGGVPGEHQFDDINELLATFEGADEASTTEDTSSVATDESQPEDSLLVEGLVLPDSNEYSSGESAIHSVSSSATVNTQAGPSADANRNSTGRPPIRLSGTIFPIH